MNGKKTAEIIKISNGVMDRVADEIAVERLLDIYVNKELYASLMCTPEEKIELAIGYLFAEGIISSMESVKSITELTEDIVCAILNHDIEEGSSDKDILTSGCAKGRLSREAFDGYGSMHVESVCKFSSLSIIALMKEFNQKSSLFIETGGAHSCAICTKDEIIYFSEDIGRHNALDKVIGKSLRRGLELKDKLLLTTGRISSDIAIKAAKAGIPIIVSHSAATDMAIEIAKASNITMVGFARGNRMNIYCGNERIFI